MSHTAHKSSLLRCGIVALIALGFASHGAPVQASVTASPDIIVNSTLDTNLLDNNLTLREALEVANGSLTGPFSVVEQLQMPGCTFTSGSVSSGCGAGVADEIGFASALSASPNIALIAPLPAITDTMPITIDGGANNVYPVINASGAGAGQDGLTVLSDRNYISGISIESAQRDGLVVYGAHNLIEVTSIYSSTRNGIWLAGSNNTLATLFLGTLPTAPFVCAGQLTGVAVTGDQNFIDKTNASCSSGAGMDISGATGTTIQYATIGITDGNARPNATGVLIRGGATSTRVLTSTIQFNSGLGVWIRDAGTELTQVEFSTIANQGDSGVQIDNGATRNTIGGYDDAGNTIVQNAREGVYITGPDTRDNRLMGNFIGTDGFNDLGNGLNGVAIDQGARQNAIGYNAAGNIIGGNGGHGVLITNGALTNTLQSNQIGVNKPMTAAVPNDGDGVRISAGASDNFIGAPLIALRGAALARNRALAPPLYNTIAGNAQNGVVIAGFSSRYNTVADNDIGGSRLPANAGDGVAIDAARDNTIDSADISYNGRNGVNVFNGAQNNLIVYSYIFSNTLHGAVLDGVGTSFNVISSTLLEHNGLDGIAERNDAAANNWRNLYVARNGGLGIDKDAASDAANITAAPAVTITAISLRTGVISGTARLGTAALSGSVIDVYRIVPGDADPSGYGEGSYHIGVVNTDGSGNWSIASGALPAGCYTAVATEHVIVPMGSSEFAHNFCVYEVLLPLTLR